MRLAWNDQVRVKQVLDAGARNLLFPFVQSADEARAAVSYTRYPPEGVRGVAAVHRGSRFGQTKDYLKNANERHCRDHPTRDTGRHRAAAEIAAVPGVDSLFVGPGDLSAAMGRIGEVGHAEVQALIAKAAEGARAAGKPIGIVGPNPEMVVAFRRTMATPGLPWRRTWDMLTGRAARLDRNPAQALIEPRRHAPRIESVACGFSLSFEDWRAEIAPQSAAAFFH